MPASTPIRNLPYPLPTDPVAHGADDIKALALALDGAGTAVVTTLPTTGLYDGLEVVLVDSLAAPAYAWRLRYTTAITGVNKWLCVGGSEAFNIAASGGSAGQGGAWVFGPAVVTVPRAGDYDVSLMAVFNGGNGQAEFGASVNGAAPVSTATVTQLSQIIGTYMMMFRVTGVPAAGQIKLGVHSTTAGTVNFYVNAVRVRPVACI